MRKSKLTICQALNAVAILALAMSIGCEKPPEITEHKIPKGQSGLEALREKPRSMVPPMAAATIEKRMVVAIFDNADATWFFKVNGPKAVVDSSEPKWQSVIDSVEFADGQPKWKAEDWKTLGPKPFRHATLIVPETEPPLEVAISSLGPNQDLLLNVNRWRGQLGLPNVSKEELSNLLKDKTTDSGDYIYFEAIGQGSGQMRPPFAGSAAPFAGNAKSNPFANAPFAGTSPASKLKFETPQGWTEGRTSSIVHARLSKESEDGTSQMTIVEMPADANDWKPNVERWAGQVGMKLDDDQVVARSKTISVDGTEGDLIDLVSDSEAETGTIAAMIKRDGSAWFIKLSGERKSVDNDREEFDKFLKSISFN